MTRSLRPSLVLAFLLATIGVAQAQADRNAVQVKSSNDAATISSSDPNSATTDPLVRMLITKGVLTEEEGRTISAKGTPAEQRDRLAALLRDKGLISAAEFEAVRAVAPLAETPSLATASSASTTDVLKPEASKTVEKQAAAPTVIAAIAPVRLLQVDPPKREGLIPDIKLGSG